MTTRRALFRSCFGLVATTIAGWRWKRPTPSNVIPPGPKRDVRIGHYVITMANDSPVKFTKAGSGFCLEPTTPKGRITAWSVSYGDSFDHYAGQDAHDRWMIWNGGKKSA